MYYLGLFKCNLLAERAGIVCYLLVHNKCGSLLQFVDVSHEIIAAFF